MWTPKYNISTSKAQDFLISQTHMIFPKESKSFEKLSCFPRDPRLLLWWILARSCLGEVVLTFSSSSSPSLSSVSTELRMSSFMDRFLSTSALLVLMNFMACSSLRHWDLIFKIWNWKKNSKSPVRRKWRDQGHRLESPAHLGSLPHLCHPRKQLHQVFNITFREDRLLVIHFFVISVFESATPIMTEVWR